MVEPITIATQALNIGKTAAANPSHNAALVTGDVSAAGRLGASAIQTLNPNSAPEKSQSSTSGQTRRNPKFLDRSQRWLDHTNAKRAPKFSSAEKKILGSRPWEGGSVSSTRESNFQKALSPDRLGQVDQAQATRIKPPENPNLKANLGKQLDLAA